MTAVTGQAVTALPGSQFPLGATICDGGTNFAVASAVADGMLLCLFDEGGTETQIRLRDYDAGVWHAFVPGIGAGRAYGYRATGPYDPVRGVRCNPAKLLLDPYARALSGSVTFGAEVLGYAVGDPDAPNTADSAACVPHGLPGPGGVEGQAERRTMGCRPDGQLRPRPFPAPVARVEREVPGHDA